MVVDIHVHGSGGEAGCDRLVALAEAAGIDRLVLLGDVLAHGYDPTPAGVRAANDATLVWLRRRPDRCVGFAYLNPRHDPAQQRDELLRCLAGGMVGLKLWVALRCADPAVEATMALAAEFGLPVLQHCWYKTVGQLPGESTPADLAALARRHPSVNFIMAHLTGGGQRGVGEVRELGNVWVDTSGSQPVAGLVEYAVHELGEQRLLFGSDAPGRDLTVALERVRAAELSPRQKRLVLGQNAARLLRLEEAGR
ncbi:MAG: amidohydrolase family protein [Fimbriimonadaceae bacterium]|nr:amidohydrolase family protein [Fimbriimonadaceae bacterium]